MPVKRWPEISLPCKHGHESPSEAGPGTKVDCRICKHGDCPQCGPAGQRVALWVPASRARTARELAGLAAVSSGGPDPGRELMARWASEPGWDGRQLPDWPGRPSDRCAECGGPLTWEPGRTWTNCDAVGDDCGVSLPAAVTAHYEHRAEVATRASAEVATRPDPAAEQAARVRLRALKAGARQRVESWLDTIADPDAYDRQQDQRQARELAAMLGGWLPEVMAAGDESAFVDAWKQTEALVTGDQGQALSAEYEEAQIRTQRQAEARQRTIEYEQQRRDMAEQQEREQREAERAERQAEREQARERKAITSGTTRRPDAASAFVPLAIMIEQNRQAKARQIADNGECGFRHRGHAVATRAYAVPARDWRGQMTGRAVPGTPYYRACDKHHGAAEATLTNQGYSDIAYWPAGEFANA